MIRDEIRSVFRPVLRSPIGPSNATVFAIDATAAAIRAAMLDPASYVTDGWRIPGNAGARIQANARASVAMQQTVGGGYEFAAHNLLLQSSSTVWNGAFTSGQSNVLSTAVPALSPGTIVQLATRGTGGDNNVASTGATSVVAGQVVALSCYVWLPSGQTYTQVRMSEDSSIASPVYSDANLGLRDQWQRISVTGVATGANVVLALRPVAAAGTILYHTAWQTNLGPAPTAYVPTTTAAVYAPAIDWLSGIGQYGLRSEEARTNLALWSRDLTQAAWTKTSATPTLTATGIDGAANSASTLTATAANATALQAITDASAARTLTIYLRRRTGTGTVETTIDGGTTWVARTLTAAWQPFSTTATLANPSIGIRIVTSGDAVDVDAAQCEQGAFATSPILTYGSTATRAADIPIIAYTVGANGAVISDYVRGAADACRIVGTNGAANAAFLSTTFDGIAGVWDGTNQTSVANSAGLNVLARAGMTYTPSAVSVCLNGGTVANGPHSGALGSVSQMVLGGDDGGGVNETAQTWTVRVRAQQQTLTSATLQALTA